MVLLFLLLVIQSTIIVENEKNVPQNRHKRTVNSAKNEFVSLLQLQQHDEKCRFLKENVIKEKYSRTKRQASIDPVEYAASDSESELDRKKRSEFDQLGKKYENCKYIGSSGENCAKIFEKLHEMGKELNVKIEELNKMMLNDKIDVEQSNSESSDVLQQQRVNSFMPVPRFHEDLTDSFAVNELLNENKERTINGYFHNRHMGKISSDKSDDSSISLRDKNDDKVTPLKNQNFGMFSD